MKNKSTLKYFFGALCVLLIFVEALIIMKIASQIRPIADDYGNMANVYEEGVLRYTRNAFTSWNSSIMSVLITGLLLKICVVLPWNIAYLLIYLLLVTITYIPILLIILKLEFKLTFAKVAISFVSISLLYATSFASIGAITEVSHFYSLLGWVSNSSRGLFALFLLAVLTSIYTRETKRLSTRTTSTWIAIGFLLASMGVAEAASITTTFAAIGLTYFQRSNNFKLFRIQIPPLLVGAMTGTLISFFGPGSQSRSTNSNYIENSVTQIANIVIGELGKYWAETVGNLIYVFIFLILVAGISFIDTLSKRNFIPQLKNEKSIDFLKTLAIALILAYLSLSAMTAVASAFVYSAPWHVMGIKSIYFFFVFVTSLMFISKFKIKNSLISGFMLITCLLVLGFGPIGALENKVLNRLNNWKVKPSPIGYMSDWDTRWVYEGAEKLKPLMQNVGKDFPKLD